MTLALLSGCALWSGRNWDATRSNVINPINSTFHRHLPHDVQAKDLEAILAVYATPTGTGLSWDDPTPVVGGADDAGATERRLRWATPAAPGAPESIRDRWEHLLALFAEVEKAELRIHRVHWEQKGPQGTPAGVRLLVRGVGPDGDLRVLDQRARLWLEQRGASWVITGEEVTARELVAADQSHFAVATEAAGLRDVHETAGSPVFRLIGDLAAASGSAVADFDCDGFEDLALASTSRISLYKNGADGSFGEVTATSGLSAELEISATGLVFFDADNDGDPDLWVAGIRGERFYRNEGCARFVDVTEQAGIGPSCWSSMPVAADYDRDGFLDVYVVRMGDHEKQAPSPNWDARNGTGGSLYRNNGDGTFSDVTAAAGIHETGWGLAGAWADFDDDGDPDLYVGNEFGTNSLYRNDGHGRFTEVAAETGTQDRGAAMGVAWGDVDGDGHLDLFVSNMYASSRWALFHPDFPSPVPWYFSWVPRARVDAITDELTRGSTLLHNRGDGTFTDVSDASGVRDGQWGWGAELLDYDNDGRLDIYAVNGFVTGPLPDDV